MKVIHGLIFLMLFSAIFATSFGQAVSDRSADEILNKYGEIYFKFTIQDKNEINLLTKVISIDKYKGNEVFAYANREEFKGFLKYNLPYSLLPLPGTLLSDEELNMGNATKDNNNRTIWNFYPNYSQFLSYMAGFASAHPAICKVDTIGTTIQGRLLLALKISDSVRSLLLLVAGFGWAKPVPVNLYALQRRSPSAPMWVALAGPLSNFLMAIIAAIPLRIGIASGWYTSSGALGLLSSFLVEFIIINLTLMLFNLIGVRRCRGRRCRALRGPAGGRARTPAWLGSARWPAGRRDIGGCAGFRRGRSARARRRRWRLPG